MNNRGESIGNQIMFFVFLFCLVIIGVGIVSGVLIFFGGDYDARQADAEILRYRIEKCIAYGRIDISSNEAFYESCGISAVGIQSGKIIFRVCLDSEDCVNEDIEKGRVVGEGSNLQSCNFIGTKDNSAFAKCSKGIIMKEGKKYEIITGSNHRIRRVNA